MSHHSSNNDTQKKLHEAMKKMFGEFPDGRLNEMDEGAIPMAIGNENGAVTMQFPRNLNWIGFTPEQAIDVAESLINNARACGSKKPLTVKIG